MCCFILKGQCERWEQQQCVPGQGEGFDPWQSLGEGKVCRQRGRVALQSCRNRWKGKSKIAHFLNGYEKTSYVMGY